MRKDTVVGIILISFLFQLFPPSALARTLTHFGAETAGEFCSLSRQAHDCPMKNGARYCPLAHGTSYHTAAVPHHHNNYNENRGDGKQHCAHFIKCGDEDSFKGVFSHGTDTLCPAWAFFLKHTPVIEGRVVIVNSIYAGPFKCRPDRPPAA